MPVPRICEHCAGSFSVQPYRAALGHGRFCSVVCHNRSMAAAHLARRPPLAQRFWERVDTSGGAGVCWPWRSGKTAKGYGTTTSDDGKRQYAHRLAWELRNGPIPEGMNVLHRCDNPPCCNPAHLFLGTKADNSADMVAKGRSVHGERQHNARLNEAQVREIREKRAAGSRLRALAAEYGVHTNTILRVTIDRKRPGSWTHVSSSGGP